MKTENQQIFEIEIGSYFCASENRNLPTSVMLVSKEEAEILKYFADFTKDKELNKIYKINQIEFKIVPHRQIITRQ